MRIDLPAAASAFSVAVHGALAFELAHLLADDESFSTLWSRPRRTGLKLAFKTLALATVAAASAARRQTQE
jgi:alkylhydroperoxidase/carboxymuconolactone decarboxylase family protein YurZ